jgi:alkylglycerol monooxygenase
MRPGQIIVLATPVFFLLIAVEFAVGRVRARRGTGHDTYRLADAVNSIGLGMLSQISAVLTGLLRIGIYTAVYAAVALFPQEAAREFWTTWYGWLLALVFYDLCYYWLHRMGHESAVLWAAHVVHHQSQHYNLSTALRQTSSGALFGWLFYLPMAVAGVPPLVFGVVALVDLLYQFWVHTEQVGKLGWFDRWFCSPSNHRVHHAVNDRYLDRNYGGILIVWDRMFGTFREEDERCVYGTRGELRSWDPLWANAEVYWALAKDSWHARSWADKLRVWLKPPGWRPADVAARFPKASFDIAQVTRYEPVVGGGVQWFAGVQFVLLLAGVAVFLWFSDAVALPRAAVWLAALTAALWAIGGVLQGRLSVTEVLLVEAAALATASAALGLEGLHHACKPLALSIAIFFAPGARWRIGGCHHVRWIAADRSGGLAGGRRAADGLGEVVRAGAGVLPAGAPGLHRAVPHRRGAVSAARGAGGNAADRRGDVRVSLAGRAARGLADSGRRVCGGDRLHGGAGHRAGGGAARQGPGRAVGGGGRVLVHAERCAAGNEPVRVAAAAGVAVGAGDVLRGADIDRAARASRLPDFDLLPPPLGEGAET